MAKGGAAYGSPGARGVFRALLAGLGLALFDVGQQFARPVLGNLSGRLDVVLLAAQALATALVLLVAWRRSPSQGRSPLGLGAVLAALCALSQAVIFSGEALGNRLPAYVGTLLCGASFGVGFALWLWLACCTGAFGGERRAPVAVLGALTAGRAAALAMRSLADAETGFLIGIACIDCSAVLLVALQLVALRAGDVRGQKVVPRFRDWLPTLLGVGLFSMLFGLTTQVHNNANPYSSVPDELSSFLTLAVLAILMARVAASPKPLRVDRFFIVTIPLIAGVMAAAPLFWASVSDVADALVKSFFNVYFAVLFVYVVQAGRLQAAPAAGERGRDPLVLPAFALTVLWACVTAGSLVGLTLMTAVAESATAVTSAFLAATWVCVVAMVALSRVGRPERVVERVVPGEPAVVYVDRAEEQLRILGDEVGLSVREREVCALLVQGRSAARIGTELVLSQNTVKTHLQNIYAKAGVHTKQELLDRLAAVGLPGEGEAR